MPCRETGSPDGSRFTVRPFARPNSMIAIVSNRVLLKSKCGLSVFSRGARRYPSILKILLSVSSIRILFASQHNSVVYRGGDHPLSLDSRISGPLSREDIAGGPLMVWGFEARGTLRRKNTLEGQAGFGITTVEQGINSGHVGPHIGTGSMSTEASTRTGEASNEDKRHGYEKRDLRDGRVCSINASTLQRFNASTLQRFNASTLQRFNASTLQRFNASLCIVWCWLCLGCIRQPRVMCDACVG